MDQWLMPLTASIVCKEGGLPQDKSIALTAAALVLQGPLAIAPALVAVEEHKRSRERSPFTDDPEPASGEKPPKVGPALVAVPDVVGTDFAKASETLKGASLVAKPRYVRSETAKKDIVIMQDPAGGGGVLVDENSAIRLAVGAGPAPSIKPVDDSAAIAELKADVDTRMADLTTSLGALDSKVGDVKTQIAAIAETLKNLDARLPAPTPVDTTQKPPKG
jgi:hypothetical protein